MDRRHSNGRTSRNNHGGESLNVNSAPTVAAMAFEKAMSEKSEKPSIATQYVPPVEEKKAVTPRKSPFKQVKRPDGADVEAAAEEVKKEEKEKAPNIALNFIPMPVAKHEEINPFKSASSEKGPIKRPASASVNRAAALKAEAEAGETEAAEEEKKEEAKYTRPSFTAALREHERATSFRPSNEFGMQEKIDPFKHNAAPEGDAEASEEKAEEEKPAFKSISESTPAPAQVPVEEPKHKGKGLKGLFGRH